MPIDFFQLLYKTSSSAITFGLCDDPPPANDPAYIDVLDSSRWIAEVINSNELLVDLHPIDNCVEIRRENGDMESRCDCMLHYNNNLTFVELKDRATSGWLGKGSDQVSITIRKFQENYNLADYDKVEAYVSNKQRPLAVTGCNEIIQKFRDETGLRLRPNRTVSIE